MLHNDPLGIISSTGLKLKYDSTSSLLSTILYYEMNVWKWNYLETVKFALILLSSKREKDQQKEKWGII